MKKLVLVFLAVGMLAFGQTGGSVTYSAANITPAKMAASAGTCTAGSATSQGVCCTATGSATAVPSPVINIACQFGPATANYQVPLTAQAPSYKFQQGFGVNEVDMTFTLASGVITAVGTSMVSGAVVQTQTGTF